MVGKYTGLSDAYLSVIKALQHACLACSRKLVIDWIDAQHLEKARSCCRCTAWSGKQRCLRVKGACQSADASDDSAWTSATSVALEPQEAQATDPAAHEAAWTALKKSDGVLVPGIEESAGCFKTV